MLLSAPVGKCTQPAKPDQPPAGPQLRPEGEPSGRPKYVSVELSRPAGRPKRSGWRARRTRRLTSNGLKPLLRASTGGSETPWHPRAANTTKINLQSGV